MRVGQVSGGATADRTQRRRRAGALAALATALVVAGGVVGVSAWSSAGAGDPDPVPAASVVGHGSGLLAAGAVAVQASTTLSDRSRFWVNASSPYSNVLALQYLLRAYGITSPVTGKYDAATNTAVKRFQAQHKLVVDGSAGPITMKAMVGGTNTAARYGWPNKYTVKAAQQLLVKFGYKLAVDGSFGPSTRSTVLAFQKAKGLSQTGIVKFTTWSWLFNPPPAPVTLGSKIASIARGELANPNRNVERGGHDCNYYTAFWGTGYGICGSTGFRSEAWCSDFAKYVWYKAGANVKGLSAWAPNFRDVYGKQHGTNHRYNPKVGDAVTYDWNRNGTIDHVEIVVAVSGSTFTAIGGNAGTNNAHISQRTMSISNSQVVTFVSPVKG